MSSNIKIIKTFQPTLRSLLSQSNFFIRRNLYKFIKNNVNVIHGIILDFGCGESPYKKLFNYEKYIGVDIGESGHDNSKNTDVVFFDGKTIPFKDNYFDSFIATEVFEHVFDINHTLNEINRVIKIGGYGIITIPFFIEEHEQPYDFARYTSFGIIYLLKSKGFEITTHLKSGDYGKVIVQGVRNYIGLLFSSKIPILNLVFKILFVLPLHILFLLLYNIIPPINKDLYFNHLLVVKKTKDIL